MNKEKTTVYIVEDSKIFSSWIASELDKIKGIEIIGNAPDMREGLSEILKLMPEILILDIRLASGTGLNILKAIREKGLPIKVIVFTNFHFYKDLCLKLGCDYFFDKSNDFAEMIETVESLIKQ